MRGSRRDGTKPSTPKAMQESTGIIQDFQANETLPKGWIPLKRKPTPDCRTCKGTGVKKITATGKRKPCHCVI